MNPKFYLILKADELSEELENAVFEAGFDDSSLVTRGGRAAIWIRHRPGELKEIVHEALSQAARGGVSVLHVEMENSVFAWPWVCRDVCRSVGAMSTKLTIRDLQERLPELLDQAVEKRSEVFCLPRRRYQ